MEVPYTEQYHLHGQGRGVPYKEQSPKTKENDVIMILSSLAYITLIKLSFCTSASEKES